MIIYNYNDDGVYLDEGEANVNPLVKDEFLIPRNATELINPAFGENQIPVFANGGWTVKPDFRGTTYWIKPERDSITIEHVNIVPPVGAVFVEWPQTKEEVGVLVIEQIEITKIEKNREDFLYNTKLFVSDKDSIQSTQNECLTRTGSDPIPTMVGTEFEGQWIITDDTAVTFNCSEFIIFASAFFNRGSANFTNRTIHKMSVETLIADEAKTVEDINNYDFSGGWA